MGSPRFQIVGLLLVGLGGCLPQSRTFPGPGPGERTVVAKNGDVENRSVLRVPPGHLPRPGECRLWFPGRPPGHQPRAGSCRGLQRIAPAGSWILYRPTSDKKVVHARLIDPKRDGVVIAVRIYDVDRGTYIKTEKQK